MRITPITIGQTLSPMSATVKSIDRVEKRMASGAVAGQGGALSAGKGAKSGKTRRAGAQRPQMTWHDLGQSVDVFA